MELNPVSLNLFFCQDSDPEDDDNGDPDYDEEANTPVRVKVLGDP